ncbi:MAG: hypothetical protein DRH37_01000 [Deltaproteobacteria bacterium]|nr:MAG: hypothetical protein DRH37_01000 [Deltaproteobacteria bacterium]
MRRRRSGTPHLSACLPVPSGRQTGYAQQVIPQIDAGIAEKFAFPDWKLTRVPGTNCVSCRPGYGVTLIYARA